MGSAVFQEATPLPLCGQFQNKANQNVKCTGIGTNVYFTIVNVSCLLPQCSAHQADGDNEVTPETLFLTTQRLQVGQV